MFGLNLDSRSITFNLLMVNIVMFVADLFLSNLFNVNGTLGMYYVGSPFFLPVQLVTHFFLHGGFTHILFNMYGLVMFGSILERVWGPKRFLFFYLFTAIGAAILHQAVQGYEIYQICGSFFPDEITFNQSSELQFKLSIPTVGASGALFGILAAFAYLFPNTELYLMFIPVPIKAKYMMIGYGLIELYLGIQNSPSDNVAHFAHLGGALFGLILVKYWNRNKRFLY